MVTVFLQRSDNAGLLILGDLVHDRVQHYLQIVFGKNVAVFLRHLFDNSVQTGRLQPAPPIF